MRYFLNTHLEDTIHTPDKPEIQLMNDLANWNEIHGSAVKPYNVMEYELGIHERFTKLFFPP